MNISEHPLLKQAYDLCIQIEKLGCGEEFTKASIMASDLMAEIDMAKAFIPNFSEDPIIENLVHIDSHKALACNCGSVNFALLKDGTIECNKCSSKLLDSYWHCRNSKCAPELAQSAT